MTLPEFVDLVHRLRSREQSLRRQFAARGRAASAAQLEEWRRLETEVDAAVRAFRAGRFSEHTVGRTWAPNETIP